MNAFTRLARKIGESHDGGRCHRGRPGNPARYYSRRWHVIRRAR
jgi:hypothetical protein